MKKIRWLCCDESGIETVQWLAWGAVLLILIAVIYGVFNGNARLRAAIRGTTAVLATRFGSDIGARGPNGAAPCLDGPFSVQRCNGASQISFTPVQPIVFDPRTQSYVVFSPIERLVIKPAAGVPTVADPRTGELLLFDTPHQRIIRVNLIEQRVIAIDQITGVATPLPLEALLQHRLIEIQVIDAPAIAPLSLATLGVPRVLPDRLALLAAFVGGAGLLGLARRGAQWWMPASGGLEALRGARLVSEQPLQQQHDPGGPYHPPEDVKLRCTASDSCASLSTKINYLKHTIRSHIEWDNAHPDPRYPGGRHDQEIADYQCALARCIEHYQRRCTQKRRRPKPTEMSREPAPETLPDPAAARRVAIATAIGAGVGMFVGGIIGAMAGGAGGTLVAPGVGTVGGGLAGGATGALEGAALGGLIGGAVMGAAQAVWEWMNNPSVEQRGE